MSGWSPSNTAPPSTASSSAPPVPHRPPCPPRRPRRSPDRSPRRTCPRPPICGRGTPPIPPPCRRRTWCRACEPGSGPGSCSPPTRRCLAPAGPRRCAPCSPEHSSDRAPRARPRACTTSGAPAPRRKTRRYGRPIRLPLHGQCSLGLVAGRYGASVEADPAGISTMSSTRHWSPGDQVTWTYYTPQHPTRTVRPGTVVLDDDRGVVVWIAPGTEGLVTAPRVQSQQLWTGNGILMIGLPDLPYSIWLFYKDDGSLGCYYINLETPYERTDEGVCTRDLVLDLVVLPRRDWHYKDEDELEGAERTGYFTAEEVEAIREAGVRAEQHIADWSYPFSAGYEYFFPDPKWPIPTLPGHYTWDLDLTRR